MRRKDLRHVRVLRLSVLVLLCAMAVGSCQTRKRASVIVYTSVDQHFSEPVLKRFEEETDIRVLAVYDVEAAKTTGLVNRLIAEKENPQADVFWNGEFAQTILLQHRGVLQPYHSPSAEGIPPVYRDPGGYWTGFGGRVRVILVNRDLVASEDTPRSIFDLLDPKWPRGDIGVAYPLFGTTSTHAAALYAALGPEQGRAFFETLRDRGARVVDGNSVVRDMVADGTLRAGLTDSDDACGAIERGAPVTIVLPDQDGLGTLVIPNTVALIANAPHPREARLMLDYLLSEGTEAELAAIGWSHASLRGDVRGGACLNVSAIRGMDVSLAEVHGQLERAQRELREDFVR